MITVNKIIEILPNLKILAGEKGISKTVESVTVLDAPDGIQWLKGGEFVITTLFPFQESNKTISKTLLPTLAQKNVSALGIKLNRYVETISSDIVEQSNKLSLPIILIPYDYAWIDIINSIMSKILNRQAEELKELSNIRDLFVQELLHERGLEGIASLLYELLHHPVSIFSFYNFHSLNYPPSFEPHVSKENLRLIDTTDIHRETICEKSMMMRMAQRENPESSWVQIPISIAQNQIGFLVVWEEDGCVDEAQMSIINQALPLIALKIHESKEIQKVEQRFKEQLLQLLLADSIDCPQTIDRHLNRLNLYLGEKNIVVIINSQDVKFLDPQALILIQQIKTSLKYLMKKLMKSENPINNHQLFVSLEQKNRIFIILPYYKTDDYYERVYTFFYSSFHEILASHEYGVGIGRVYQGYEGISKSYREALKALDLCWYKKERVLFYKDQGLYRIILEIPRKERESFFHETIGPLLEYDRVNNSNLVETLKIFLDNRASYNLTAKEMYLHPNTIRYRIEKIKAICSYDLDSFDDLLEMALGIKIIPFI